MAIYHSDRGFNNAQRQLLDYIPKNNVPLSSDLFKDDVVLQLINRDIKLSVVASDGINIPELGGFKTDRGEHIIKIRKALKIVLKDTKNISSEVRKIIVSPVEPITSRYNEIFDVKMVIAFQELHPEILTDAIVGPETIHTLDRELNKIRYYVHLGDDERTIHNWSRSINIGRFSRIYEGDTAQVLIDLSSTFISSTYRDTPLDFGGNFTVTEFKLTPYFAANEFDISIRGYKDGDINTLEQAGGIEGSLARIRPVYETFNIVPYVIGKDDAENDIFLKDKNGNTLLLLESREKIIPIGARLEVLERSVPHLILDLLTRDKIGDDYIGVRVLDYDKMSDFGVESLNFIGLENLSKEEVIYVSKKSIHQQLSGLHYIPNIEPGIKEEKIATLYTEPDASKPIFFNYTPGTQIYVLQRVLNKFENDQGWSFVEILLPQEETKIAQNAVDEHNEDPNNEGAYIEEVPSIKGYMRTANIWMNSPAPDPDAELLKITSFVGNSKPWNPGSSNDLLREQAKQEEATEFWANTTYNIILKRYYLDVHKELGDQGIESRLYQEGFDFENRLGEFDTSSNEFQFYVNMLLYMNNPELKTANQAIQLTGKDSSNDQKILGVTIEEIIALNPNLAKVFDKNEATEENLKGGHYYREWLKEIEILSGEKIQWTWKDEDRLDKDKFPMEILEGYYLWVPSFRFARFLYHYVSRNQTQFSKLHDIAVNRVKKSWQAGFGYFMDVSIQFGLRLSVDVNSQVYFYREKRKDKEEVNLILVRRGKVAASASVEKKGSKGLFMGAGNTQRNGSNSDEQDRLFGLDAEIGASGGVEVSMVDKYEFPLYLLTDFSKPERTDFPMMAFTYTLSGMDIQPVGWVLKKSLEVLAGVDIDPWNYLTFMQAYVGLFGKVKAEASVGFNPDNATYVQEWEAGAAKPTIKLDGLQSGSPKALLPGISAKVGVSAEARLGGGFRYIAKYLGDGSDFSLSTGRRKPSLATMELYGEGAAAAEASFLIGKAGGKGAIGAKSVYEYRGDSAVQNEIELFDIRRLKFKNYSIYLISGDTDYFKSSSRRVDFNFRDTQSLNLILDGEVSSEFDALVAAVRNSESYDGTENLFEPFFQDITMRKMFKVRFGKKKQDVNALNKDHLSDFRDYYNTKKMRFQEKFFWVLELKYDIKKQEVRKALMDYFGALVRATLKVKNTIIPSSVSDSLLLQAAGQQMVQISNSIASRDAAIKNPKTKDLYEALIRLGDPVEFGYHQDKTKLDFNTGILSSILKSVGIDLKLSIVKKETYDENYIVGGNVVENSDDQNFNRIVDIYFPQKEDGSGRNLEFIEKLALRPYGSDVDVEDQIV